MRHFQLHLALLSSIVALLSGLATPVVSAAPLQLVTPREAALPEDPASTIRMVFPGPDIVLASPAPKQSFAQPFALSLRFDPKSGAGVDVKSFALVYRKKPLVSVTERVKDFVTPGGLRIPEVRLPEGRHRFSIHISDLNSHETERFLILTVKGKAVEAQLVE